MKDRILIISAHADDESFGMGGSLSRLSLENKKYEIYWLIITEIWEPKWSFKAIESRKKTIEKIGEILRFKDIVRFNYKDNLLETYPINDLQEKIISTLDNIKPNIIFTPSAFDFNHEHAICQNIIEMSTKTYYTPYVREIICYEIPSSTDASFRINKSFPFNYYINIEKYIDKKLELISLYETELKEFPHPRSRKYIKSLAEIRGAEAGCNLAEGFCILRKIYK